MLPTLQSPNRIWRWISLVALSPLASTPLASTPLASGDESRPPADKKRVMGATETLAEASTGLQFNARIDTGARTCSIHVEEVVIDDPEEQRSKNIGKTIRFRLANKDGDTAWAESTIAETVAVKTSDGKESRYKVPLVLQWGDFKKEVLVTLNNRTKMKFPLLIGRNWLRSDFVVDVDVNPDDALLPKAKEED